MDEDNPVLRGPHGSHCVQFYDDDASLAGVVADRARPVLAGEGVVVLLVTPQHALAIEAHLHRLGFDIDALTAAGRIRILDARATLARFLRNGVPDADRFLGSVGQVIAECGRDDAPVFAYGEMVDLLWRAGNQYGALELESLWNDLAHVYGFTLLCGYARAAFAGHDRAGAYRTLCGLHAGVVSDQEPLVLGALNPGS